MELTLTHRDVLKKYGNLKMTFCTLDRHRAKYKSLTGDVIATFVVEYRDSIQCDMWLESIIDYGYVDLEINGLVL